MILLTKIMCIKDKKVLEFFKTISYSPYLKINLYYDMQNQLIEVTTIISFLFIYTKNNLIKINFGILSNICKIKKLWFLYGCT
jgi:hypothetical protein